MKYFCKCCRRKSEKKLYLSLENGIFLINKKLELVRYLKNQQMLRVIGKVTMLNHERFFFKNFYRDILDAQPVSFRKHKEGRNLNKKFEMLDFIKHKSIEKFDELDKPGKILMKNLFYQKDFENGEK